MLLFYAGSVFAIPFSVVHDYSGSGVYDDITFQKIYDKGNRIDWTDTFEFPAVNPKAETITSASFSITHVGMQSFRRNNEIWLITSTNNYNIGYLSNSGSPCYNSEWKTDTFELSNDIINTIMSNDIINTIMSNDPWALQIIISKETCGKDALYIDKASFFGEYATPVPEPASLFLLGTGLIGFAGARRRKLKK